MTTLFFLVRAVLSTLLVFLSVACAYLDNYSGAIYNILLAIFLNQMEYPDE